MVYLHLRQDRNDSVYHTVTKHVCGESNGIACIGEGVAKGKTIQTTGREDDIR